jgi:hypothetical protein
VIRDSLKLGRASAAFALSATITVLFNTFLACAKDAYQPLSRFMASLAGHNWTTQGLADLVIFFGLGLIFLQTGWAGKMDPRRLIFLLTAAVVVAGAGLFVWYVLV